MDKFIITETVNENTNLISLNNEGTIVTVKSNPMELPGFMTKEQAFKVIAGLRQAAQGTETKYRVKAVSQALRDMITDIIYNQLPESPMVEQEVIDKAIESWKPKVTEAKAEEKKAESVPDQVSPETEAKPAKKEKKAKKND